MELKLIKIRNLKLSEPPIRKFHTEKKFMQLKESISAKGILVPLIVRNRKHNEYEVISGNRRLKALKELKFKPDYEVLCFVVDKDTKEATELGLVENIVREGLTVLEQAESINLLVNSFDKTIEEVAKSTGKGIRHIRKILAVFDLPSGMINTIIKVKLPFSHGIILAEYNKNPELQKKLFQYALKYNLSQRDLSTYAVVLSKKQKDYYRPFAPKQALTKKGTRVRFEPRKSTIRIEINLNPKDSLENLFEVIRKNVREVQSRAFKSAIDGTF